MSKSILTLIFCIALLGNVTLASSKGFYVFDGASGSPKVSADGNIAMGTASIRTSPDSCEFRCSSISENRRWTISPTGVTAEVLPIEDAAIFATNGDGSQAVGRINGTGGGYSWTESDGLRLLGSILPGPHPYDIAFDVSNDGNTIVGSTDVPYLGSHTYGAILWRSLTDLEVIPFPIPDPCAPHASRSRATGVDGKGEVVVGWSTVVSFAQRPGVSCDPRPTEPFSAYFHAFRFSTAKGVEYLVDLDEDPYGSQAQGVSSDGNVIVGAFRDENNQQEAFRWEEGVGRVGLGVLPGYDGSFARQANGDGSRILGDVYSRTRDVPNVPFIWSADLGMRSISEFLSVEEGFDLGGIEPSSVSISDDGLVLAGGGFRGTDRVIWFADLRGPIPDAYQCYDVKGGKGSKGSKRGKSSATFKGIEVSLSDQFGDTIQIVTKGKELCAPVEIDSIEISDPEAHLMCYDLKKQHRHGHGRGHGPGRDSIEVLVSNEFGEDQHLVVKDLQRLCVSSTKAHIDSGSVPGDPESIELDHFLCYGVHAEPGASGAIEVSLLDQFAASDRLLKKAKQFCNPVAVNGEEILDSEKHLTCYEVKPLEGDPKLRDLREGVLVSNALASEQRFQVKKPKTVCVPSLKEHLGD